MSQALGRLTDPPDPMDEALLNAPLFHTLVDRLDDEQRHVVLDLGPPQAGTVALFGRFRCRLDIGDFAANLDAVRAQTEPEELPGTISGLLPPVRQERADTILCWDLFNYLERPALKALMDCVAEYGQTGTLVHALVVYSAKTMPVLPNRYVPVDDHSLRIVANARETRPAPRYSPEDLGLCMPAYRLERAMLLRNGMQEFLFRL